MTTALCCVWLKADWLNGECCVGLQCTIMMALLQPAPETYSLFDDVMLLASGETSCCSLLLMPPASTLLSHFVCQLRQPCKGCNSWCGCLSCWLGCVS